MRARARLCVCVCVCVCKYCAVSNHRPNASRGQPQASAHSRSWPSRASERASGRAGSSSARGGKKPSFSSHHIHNYTPLTPLLFYSTVTGPDRRPIACLLLFCSARTRVGCGFLLDPPPPPRRPTGVQTTRPSLQQQKHTQNEFGGKSGAAGVATATINFRPHGPKHPFGGGFRQGHLLARYRGRPCTCGVFTIPVQIRNALVRTGRGI